MRRELCICNVVTRHVLYVIVWDISYLNTSNRLKNDKASVVLCSKSCFEGLLCFYGLCIDSVSSIRSCNRTTSVYSLEMQLLNTILSPVPVAVIHFWTRKELNTFNCQPEHDTLFALLGSISLGLEDKQPLSIRDPHSTNQRIINRWHSASRSKLQP